MCICMGVVWRTLGNIGQLGFNANSQSKLHPIQPLAGDRYNIDGWLAKVNMAHSRKLARVGCMQLNLIPVSFEQKLSTLYSALPLSPLPSSRSSPSSAETDQKRRLSRVEAPRQGGWRSVVLLIQREDSWAALRIQVLPNNWVFE